MKKVIVAFLASLFLADVLLRWNPSKSLSHSSRSSELAFHGFLFRGSSFLWC